MHALLIHGMGRSPLSMAWLGLRLRVAGHRVSYFSYSAAFEDFESCVERLRRFIAARAGSDPYMAIGHSLGTVLLRSALPLATHAAQAVFLIAPPTKACAMARFFSDWKIYRVLTGDMGQRLANAEFMAQLPMPPANTLIFAGTLGPRRSWLPYGSKVNDGILAIDETQLAGVPRHVVHAMHSLIMNHRSVFLRINQALQTPT